MKKFFILLTSHFLLFTSLHAAQSEGTTSGILLRMGGNARSYAMGEAYGATAQDATSLYFNPAALGHLEGGSLDLMHAVHINPIYFDNIAFAYPVGYGNLGVGLQYLSYGKLDEVDNTGTNTGSSISPKDMALTATYAGRVVSPFLTVGASVKYLQSTIKNTATAFAGDVGFLYKINNSVPVGLAVQNLGTGLKFNNETDSLPLNVRASAAFRPKEPLLLAVDINYPAKGVATASIGAEYKIQLTQDLALAPRLGVNTRTQSSGLGALSMLSFGFGIGSQSHSFDYSLNSLGDLGITHRFSLSLKFP